MSQNPIFVSHASDDTPLVSEFVELLISGVGVQADDIFCSSLNGHGVPPGDNFIEFVKDELANTGAVVLVLTKNYYESTFCVCEMGASWALAHDLYPILVPPMQYNDVNTILSNVYLTKIDDKGDLTEFRDHLGESLGLSPTRNARWEARRDTFVSQLPELLEQIPSPESVDREEYDSLQEKYEEAQEMIKDLNSEKNRLQNLVEEVRQADSESDRDEIVRESIDEWGEFNELISQVTDELEDLPPIVREALFYHFRERDLTIDSFNQRSLDEAARKAERKDYLIEYQNGQFAVNKRDPKIERTINYIRDLKSFLDHPSEDFLEAFKEEFEYIPGIRNQRLWSDHLNVNFEA